MADQFKLISGTHSDEVGRRLAITYSLKTGTMPVGLFAILGWEKDKEIQAFALFQNYTGPNIDIHIWAPNALSRKSIRDSYRYAFNQLKCIRITANVARSNKNLLSLLERLGFVYECTITEYMGTLENPEDALIYKLTADGARKWIN